jgi:hypothetical protein
MGFTPNENLDLRDYGILPDGGTSITAWFPVAEREISDLGLTPGNTLPQQTTVDDAGDAGIVGGSYKDHAGMRHAVITAHLPAYADSIQTRTGVATVKLPVGGNTPVTSTEPIFYPSLVGETITFDGSPEVVYSYTDPMNITLTGIVSGVAVAVSFPEGSRLLTEATSDAFGWNRAGWWSITRRWLCETEDREAEMQYLKTTSYTFDGDENSPVGYPHGASSRGRDPSYPHKASITMTFEAPIYDI